MKLLAGLLIACAALAGGAATSSATVIGLGEGGSEDWVSVGKSGADLFRVTFSWQRVAEKGNWEKDAAWEATLDKVVEGSAKNGYAVLGLLAGRETAVAHKQFYLNEGAEAADFAKYQEFVAKAVKRYGRHGSFWTSHPGLTPKPITVWEVWNEPNLGEYSPGGTPLPQKYAAFLKATAKTIRTAQNGIRLPGEPNDTVVLHAGLWQGGGKTAMPVAEFVEKASKVEGWTEAFDGFGLHPYSFAGSVSEMFSGVKAHVKEAREALNAHGGSAKPIWITELGWGTEGTGEGFVTPSEQAALLSQSFTWAKTGAYGVAAALWYNYQDSGGAAWDSHAGLRKSTGGYRAAWYAFQEEAEAPRWPGAGPAVQVAYSDAGDANSISGWQYGSETGWQQMFLWGHEVAAGTRPAILRYEEGPHIFFVDADRENRITEWAWNPVTGWQQNFIATDPVAAGSSPSAVLVSGQPQVYFADAGTIDSITVITRSGSSWTQSRFYGDPVAENSSPSAISTPGSVQIYFANASHGNTLSAWVWGSTLSQVSFWGDPVAKNSSPTAVVNGGESRIYFADEATNGSIAYWNWGSTLGQTRLYGHLASEGASPGA